MEKFTAEDRYFLRDADFALSIIIPAYTEKKSLIYNVNRVLKDNLDYILELIIIVSPFADKETIRICKELAEKEEKVTCCIQKSSPGLGNALREAFNLVTGTHVQILFADCESDPAAIPLFIDKAIKTNADVIVGSRWLEKGMVHNYPPVRYCFNRLFHMLFRALYNTDLHDLTFGFNLIKVSVIYDIVWQGTKHEISMEMVVKPLRLNYHIEEIPVSWTRRSEGKSKLKLTRYLCFPVMALFILIAPRKWFRRNP
jgi:dolichol-phosphate mannosyltransferase